jgi:hypothetical protein
MSSSPAQNFVEYYEKCQKTGEFLFKQYFEEEFDFKSPIKYSVKYHNNIDNQLINISNSILKNLHLNPHFQIFDETNDDYLNEILFQGLYNLIKVVITNPNSDLNCLPKCILFLHLSKVNFDTDGYKNIFQAVETVKIKEIDLRYKSFVEFKPFYIKVLKNKQVQQFSMNVIQKVLGFKPVNYDFSKIKLEFFTANIPGLNAFAGIDSIYISLDEIMLFRSRLNRKLNKIDAMTFFKLNFLRMIQHEITHVILRDLADDLNVSTPDLLNKKSVSSSVEESGLMAEIEHFGGRVDWARSSFNDNFNIEYCRNYLIKIEADENETFEIQKANVEQYSNQPKIMALDFSFPSQKFMYE